MSLHELQRARQVNGRIEQCLDAALTAGAGRGLSEPLAADESRAGLDRCGAGHHQQ